MLIMKNLSERALTPTEKAISEMNAITKQLEGLREDNPADLQKMIMLNTRMLQPLGRIYGEATKEFKYAYGARKYALGSIKVHSNGTGIEKDGQAEIGAYEARKHEAECEGEMIRWKHAYDSTKELVQSQKLVLRALITELENTNQMS